MASLARLVIESTEVRRRLAQKIERQLPADAAQAATLLTTPSRQNVNGVPLERKMPEPRQHDSGLTVYPRIRVFVPLVEPNVLSWLRRIAHREWPEPQVTEDGILTAAWESPAQHAAATVDTYRWYLREHSAIGDIIRSQRLDSWHGPLLLAPVRHTYADGTKDRLAWMSAEGTARVVAARKAAAQEIARWAPDHPWTDPAALWPNDSVALRRLASAARNHFTVTHPDTDPEHDWSMNYWWAEDWADLAVADTDMEHKIGLWAFREHNRGGRDDLDEDTDSLDETDAEDDEDEVRALVYRLGRVLAQREAGGAVGPGPHTSRP